MSLRVAQAIAAKDLRAEVRSRSAVSTVLPFAATMLLAFGFALGPDRLLLAQAAPALLWLAALFAAVELCHRSYQHEAENDALEGLLLSPVDKGAVYLGKAAAAFVQLIVLLVVTTGIVIVLFGLPVGPVRTLPWVRQIDLAGLWSDGHGDAGDLAGDLAATEEIIETELRRYLRWLAGRSAAAALHRMRSGAEDIARQELARIAGELPADVRSAMERVLLKTVHRLVHKPTLELRAAVEADDSDLVSVLAGLFDAAPPADGRTADGTGLLAADPDTAARPRRPALDVQ